MANAEIIDADQAIKLLRRVRDSVPKSYTYVTSPDPGNGVTCVYQRDGQPSCMIGQALFLAGWDAEELALIDAEEQPTADALAANYPSLITYEAAQIFRAAQVKQDNGKTWHEAYREALGEYRFYKSDKYRADGSPGD